MAGLVAPGYIPTQNTSKPKPTPTASPTPSPATTPNPAGFTTTTNNAPGSVGTSGYGATPGQAVPPGMTPTGKTWSVDPTGMATPYTPTKNWMSGGTDWNAGTPTDLWALQSDRMMQMIRALKQEGGGPVSLAREPGLQLVGRETPSTMADRTAAESAEFGRAKDRVSKIGGSAMDALKDRMSAMGQSGGTVEGNVMGDILGDTQGQLGEVVRDQAISRMDRHDAIDDRNLTAGLTQRGQDIGQQATAYGGGITQRGQDYQGATNDPMRQMIMQLIQSMNPMSMMAGYR